MEEKPFPDIPWLGEEEILALDGEPAFLFAAGVRGRRLADRAWEWDDGSLVDLAIRRFGEDQVNAVLSAATNVAVRRFAEEWRQAKQRAEQQKHYSHRERMTAIPVEEIVRAAESDSRCFWFRGWGKHADEAALRNILRHLWAAQEPRVIANLLNVFSARALPEFDGRLIELCCHVDEEVRQRAFRALEPNAQPLVREFALTELSGGLRDGSVVSLFINNFRPGDEQLILEAMELPVDTCELHWLLMDVVKVLEKNPPADSSRLAVIAYALTPCDNCRYSATRLLVNQQVAPQWLRGECTHDSVEDCRKLMAPRTGSPDAG